MIPREELTSPHVDGGVRAVGEPVFDRGLRVAALRADAGNEEGNLGDDLADLGQLLGRGRTHDQTDVVVAVPHVRERRDALVEGSPEASSRSCRSLPPGFEVRQRTNTPFSSRSRNGWRSRDRGTGSQ